MKNPESESALSSAEQKIVDELGFDSALVANVKKAAGSSFTRTVLDPTRGLSGPTLAELNGYSLDDVEKLRAIGKQYPELAPLIDSQAAFLTEQPQAMPEIMQRQQTEEAKIANKYQAYAMQALAKSKQKGAVLFSVPEDAARSPEALEKYFQKSYANTKLEAGFRPTDVLMFELRSKDISIEKMQQYCEPLGYSFFGVDSLMVTEKLRDQNEWFERVKAGESTGFVPEPAYHQVVEFDPKKFDPQKPMAFASATLRIPGGASVKKLSETQWEVTRPAAFKSHRHISRAILAKRLDQFDFVSLMKSEGVNASVYNFMVIDKLKKFDRLYGLKVVAAQRDGVTFRLQHLPEDLSPLCTELWMFCAGTLELSQDYVSNAVRMRGFAAHLKKTHLVNFWWD